MTNANYTTWIIFSKAERSGAKEKKDGNPANVAEDGRGFITGAVFFWEGNRLRLTGEHSSYSAILKAGLNNGHPAFFYEILLGNSC
jgi:hypothetical protein